MTMLNYEFEGVGETVVLLHSGVCDLRQWDPQWSGLTSRFRTFRIDFSGFGQSQLNGAESQDSDEVLAVLDEMGVTDAVFVGSSYGGRVAQEIAIIDPSRVKKMILVCSATEGIPPTQSIVEYGAKEEIYIKAGDFDAATTLNVETWLGPKASEKVKSEVWKMQRNAFNVYLKNPTHRKLRVAIDPTQFLCPTVIITGLHDFDYFEIIGDHLSNLVPDNVRISLEWAGHLPNLERPIEFEELLISLIVNQ